MVQTDVKTNLNTLIEDFLGKDTVDAGEKILAATKVDDVLAAALSIAKVFGADDSLSFGESAEGKLVSSFHNNITLLIQKTWVESSDEDLKAQVQYKLEELCDMAKAGEWNKAYSHFIKIISDAVYLMFGAQAKKDDFLEYAFRVDPEFGTFWWYMQMLPQETDWPAEKCRILILLGMYFLANY